MSALLLGTSVSALTENNQTFLVVFVIVFPVLVLVAFLWLVARHHTKLYAPLDYRSDEGFLAQPGVPVRLGERIVEEADAVADVTPVPMHESKDIETQSSEGADRISEEPLAQTNTPLADQRRAAVANAYLAEGLAFKELQEEFGQGVRQHVRVKTSSNQYLEIDGIIETGHFTYLVEVKIVGSLESQFQRVREAVLQINRLVEVYDGAPSTIKGMIVLVASPGVDILRLRGRTLILTQASQTTVAVRIYSLDAMLEKYGFNNI